MSQALFGQTSVHNTVRKVTYKPDSTSASLYTGIRSGLPNTETFRIPSIAPGRANLRHNDERMKSAMAELQDKLTGGAVFMNLKDSKGNAITKPYTINGVVYQPDATGQIRILDGEFMERRKKYFEEREALVDQMMEMCTMSDEDCALCLGVERDALKIYLGAGYEPPGLKDYGLSPADMATLTKASGMPSVLKYVVNKDNLAAGYRKLRIVVERYGQLAQNDSFTDSIFGRPAKVHMPAQGAMVEGVDDPLAQAVITPGSVVVPGAPS